MIHTGQEEPRVFKIQIGGDLLDAKLLSTDSLLPRPDACHSDKLCKAGLAESGLRCSANFGAGV